MAKEKEIQEDKNLDNILAELEKKFGRGTIWKASSREVIPHPAIPSGSFALDKALGIGGYPEGRIVEIWGPESSGKTTLTLHAIAEVQRAGGLAAFIDAEHALDRNYAGNVGVDDNKLYLCQPDCGETALEIVDTLVKSGKFKVIVIDSVSALTPRAELEGEMDSQQMGLQARLMSKAMRKLSGVTAQTGTTLIFINQIREKMVMFGSPITTSGGNALKFYASARIKLNAGTVIEHAGVVLGKTVTAEVIKNKLAPPFRKATFDILFGKGIDNIGTILDSCQERNIVQRAGAWYSYKGDKLGQGRQATIEGLAVNPQLLIELTELLKKEDNV